MNNNFKTAVCLRNTFIPALVILVFHAVFSQLPATDTTSSADTLSIGLQQAILLCLQNNSTVTIQRLTPDIMSTYIKERKAAFDPQLDVTGQQTNTKSQRRLGAQPKPFPLEEKRFDVSAQVSEELPTGTSVAVSSGMSGSTTDLYTDQYTGNLGLSVTQSLLRGFGFRANLADLRKARLDVDISRSELKGVAEKTVSDMEKSYWDLYLAGQETGINQKSLELAQQQLAESQERVNVGKLAELELAAVNAEVSARKSALIDAQSKYEQARLRFLYLLNPDTGSFWSRYPALVDKPFIPVDTLDGIGIHEELGMKFRPDLIQARLSLKKGDLDLARTKNGLLPKLDFFITLGKTSYAASFGGAYPDLSSPYYQVNAGLNFAMPVPNRTGSAQLARARYSQKQQNLAVKNMEKLVQLDIRSAHIEVLRSRQQIQATRVTRELQEKKLAAELEKFRVGKSTNYLVLQAQRDFTTSLLTEARSMVAYLIALVDLYYCEGTLLERRGISSF